MSRNYRLKMPKALYNRLCTRPVRNKNKHLLRCLIQKYCGDDLDYNVLNVSNKEVYSPYDYD